MSIGELLLRMLGGNKTRSLHKRLISNHLSQRGIILPYYIFPIKCILIENENGNELSLPLHFRFVSLHLFFFFKGAMICIRGFQVAPEVKNPPANAGDMRDMGSLPGLGRSLEEGMATYFSILSWRIPWTEKPGGLQSKESHNQTQLN